MSNGPLIKAWHSSDLTNPCKRAVYHRHRGEFEPVATTALVRGLAAGHALAEIHLTNKWPTTPDEALACADFGLIATVKQVQSEGRPISESVEKNMAELTQEIGAMIGHYSRRQKDYFAKCKVVGCEVPVRMALDIPGREEPAQFESHLDLLFYDPDGQLVVRDWKAHDEPAGFDYLGRNAQMCLYFLVITEGWCKVGNSGDDTFDWVNYGVYPMMQWFDLSQLRVYSRKTTITNWDGSQTTYEKGEDRPMATVCRQWMFHPDKINEMKAELARHVVLGDAGIWLMNPDKVRCFLCESKKWCPCFHKEPSPV